MGLDTAVAKIIFAFIFALFLIWIVRPGIQIIGLTTCPNCNPFINAFIFVVVPVGAVFVGIYQVMGVFTRRT